MKVDVEIGNSDRISVGARIWCLPTMEKKCLLFKINTVQVPELRVASLMRQDLINMLLAWLFRGSEIPEIP
jgi:hypothetical protein